MKHRSFTTLAITLLLACAGSGCGPDAPETANPGDSVSTRADTTTEPESTTAAVEKPVEQPASEPVSEPASAMPSATNDDEILIVASAEDDTLRLNVDHASIIKNWDQKNQERGALIYAEFCVPCHGADGLQTNNENARAFGRDAFKNAADPVTLWRTLTSGIGDMPAHDWLSPQERYDVIHYLREAIVKESNPSQYVAVNAAYLEGLPVEEVEYRPLRNQVVELSLFNGKDLSEWSYRKGDADVSPPPSWQVGTAALDPDDPAKLIAKPGGTEMVNPATGENILSNTVHGDAIIVVEVLVAKGSNSGIYVQGRYEIQVFDSHGIDPNSQDWTATHMGAIYGRRRGASNPSKPPGEWNKFEINFAAPRFDAKGNKIQNAKLLEVVLNGEIIHQGVEMEEQTFGGPYAKEGPVGALYLQGDHGPVAYRNLEITPITKQAERDFGPALGSQIGREVSSAFTIRLSHGTSIAYNLQRMSLASTWQGEFLNLDETHHYREWGSGKAYAGGAQLPGLESWYWGFDNTLDYPREGVKPRSPLPEDWLDYHGHYLHGDRAILSYAINGRDVLETPEAHMQDRLLAVSHSLHISAGSTPLKLCVGTQNQEERMVSGVVPLDGSSLPVDKAGPAETHLALSAAMKPDGTLGEFVVAALLGETGGVTWEADFELACPPLAEGTPDTPCKPHPGPQDETAGGQLPFQSEGVTGYGYASNVAPQFNDPACVAVGQCPAVDDPKNSQHARTAIMFGPSRREYYEVVLDKPLCVRGIDYWFITYEQNLPPGFDVDPAVEYWNPNTCEYVRVEDQVISPGDYPTMGKRNVSFRPTKSTRFRFSKSGQSWLYVHRFELLEIEDRQRLSLLIPPGDASRVVRVVRSSGKGQADLDRFVKLVESLRQQDPVDPGTMTKGGPRRWPETMVTRGKLSTEKKDYVVDTIPLPEGNPWNAWIRTAAFDFFKDGRIAISTHGGDVYVVSGIEGDFSDIRWRRFATGLYEPMGLRVVDDVIYTTCRDRLVRLHDINNDGEADFFENFYSDRDVSTSYHAYSFDLQTDTDGNFYYVKTGRFTEFELPGAVIKVSPDGKKDEVYATGFRVPNGMGIGADNVIYTGDNQGEWIPASKINRVKPGGFYGVSKATAKSPETFDRPIVWMPQECDSSSGGQVWVDDKRWGPLSGRLLHTSFGKGKVYSVMMQDMGDVVQAAVVALPLEFESGIMRGRVNHRDGQVYVTGLTGWGHPVGSKDGCLHRVRYTGEKSHLLLDTRVETDGVRLTFSCALDPEIAANVESYKVEEWQYLWRASYGSKHYSPRNPQEEGQDVVPVTGAVVSEDGKSVVLKMPSIHPVDQMKIVFKIQAADAVALEESVYLTIHRVPGA